VRLVAYVSEEQRQGRCKPLAHIVVTAAVIGREQFAAGAVAAAVPAAAVADVIATAAAVAAAPLIP
jgi:hypothetical protein